MLISVFVNYLAFPNSLANEYFIVFSGFLLKGLQRFSCQLLNCLFAADKLFIY